MVLNFFLMIKYEYLYNFLSLHPHPYNRISPFPLSYLRSYILLFLAQASHLSLTRLYSIQQSLNYSTNVSKPCSVNTIG
jgi:hypothetical protein